MFFYNQVTDLIAKDIGEQTELFEVGCGSGLIYEYLRKRIKIIYRCGDVSENFRMLVKERYPELDPMFTDIHQLPFKDAELENVININVLQHLPYYEKPVQEFCENQPRVKQVSWFVIKTPFNSQKSFWIHIKLGDSKEETEV